MRCGREYMDFALQKAQRAGVSTSDQIVKAVRLAISTYDAYEIADQIKDDYDPDPGDHSTELLKAVNRGKELVVKLLLSMHANPNKTDDSGVYAVVVAARQTSHHAPVCMRLLLEAKGDPDVADPVSGHTALMLCASRSRGDLLASLLLEAEADPDLCGAGGRAPLHEAAVALRPAAVQTLLSRRAWPDAADDDFETPLGAMRREAPDCEASREIEALLANAVREGESSDDLGEESAEPEAAQAAARGVRFRQRDSVC